MLARALSTRVEFMMPVHVLSILVEFKMLVLPTLVEFMMRELPTLVGPMLLVLPTLVEFMMIALPVLVESKMRVLPTLAQQQLVRGLVQVHGLAHEPGTPCCVAMPPPAPSA